MKKLKYVAVYWNDAALHPEEKYLKDGAFPLAELVTAGILIRETKKKVSIAQDFMDLRRGGKFQVRQVISIPRANIIKMLELKPK